MWLGGFHVDLKSDREKGKEAHTEMNFMGGFDPEK